jgi:hypothetical protein
MSWMARAAAPLTARTCGCWYAYDALPEPLAQHLEDLAAALGEFILEAHTVVRPHDGARHRHGEVPAADQPHVGDGVMGDAK